MKVRVIENEEKEEMPYPKLMEGNSGTIVLMEARGCGTSLRLGKYSSIRLGEYSQDWAMDCFKDFEGKLELSNK